MVVSRELARELTKHSRADEQPLEQKFLLNLSISTSLMLEAFIVSVYKLALIF